MTQAKPWIVFGGERLRATRETKGLRQDDVARAAMARGFPWYRGTVAQIEGGHRELSVPEFFALLQILGQSVAEVFGAGDDLLELSPSFKVRAADIGQLLSGRGATFFGPNFKARTDVDDRTTIFVPAPTVAFEAPTDLVGEAETHAASRLGRSIPEIQLLSSRLWGHSLSIERDLRMVGREKEGLSPRSRQALRGHITRQLLEELDQRFDLEKKTTKKKTTTKKAAKKTARKRKRQ